MVRLVIAGQGAIGSLLAAHCEQHRCCYAVIPRSGQPKNIKYVHQANKRQWDFTPPNLSAFQANDVLVLPLKAYHILSCLQQLDVPANVTILLLHNGMGTIEQVKRHFAHNPIIAGITSYAAFKPANHSVIETGQGTTQLGWISHPDADIQSAIQSLFNQILGPCQWQDNIQLALWNKLAINAAINPLTAIHNIPNGKLQDPQFSPTISAICQEVAAVMNKTGLCQTSDNLRQQIDRVIAATADNFSSMNRDIVEGRPTEIDYINGYIVQQAEKLAINIPVIKQLMEQLLAIQNNRGNKTL
ncbi:ketopantoate reductase family protein [Neptunicella sp.]|uniref:ketopantoate reductase family protein n=1 Tax=Neptunicella sp. TaxID=2125986 RepID=UPI003F68D637